MIRILTVLISLLAARASLRDPGVDLGCGPCVSDGSDSCLCEPSVTPGSLPAVHTKR